MQGKRALILGVANAQSLAWHVAGGLKAAGAEVHIGYQQRFKSRVMQLLKEATVPPDGVHRCDVTDEAELAALFASVGGPLHVLVHSVAYAPPESFGRPVQACASAEFGESLGVSAWSLLAVARHAEAHFAPEASVMAMTYLGASRVVQGYRLMGIAKAALEAAVRELASEIGPRGVRVNAISAGPVATLAALAVPDFDRMLARYAEIAPLRTAIHGQDVANLAVFLASDASRRITGQVLTVDAGFSILAVAT